MEKKPGSRRMKRSSHSWRTSESSISASSLDFRPRTYSATSSNVNETVSERVKEVIRTQDLFRLHAVERRRRKEEERRRQQNLLERKKLEETELKQQESQSRRRSRLLSHVEVDTKLAEMYGDRNLDGMSEEQASSPFLSPSVRSQSLASRLGFETKTVGFRV
eukprot:760044-Hanusia_phi.AAC.5